MLERTRSNRFSRWFYRRPCGLTTRVAFPRGTFPRFPPVISLRLCDDARSRVSRRYDISPLAPITPIREVLTKGIPRFRPRKLGKARSPFSAIVRRGLLKRDCEKRISLPNKGASQATRTCPPRTCPRNVN